MNIYVGNLPFSATEDELRQLFSEYGQVQSAKIIIDRETGRSKGFGFVEMSDNIAQTAITELNQSEYEGKKLTVNEARPKRDNFNDNRGGGRGGFGGGSKRW